MTGTFSFETKLSEVEYEIRMRQQVYPGSVATKRLSQSQAEMKIAIMEAIAQDYRNAIARRQAKQEGANEQDTAGQNQSTDAANQ